MAASRMPTSFFLLASLAWLVAGCDNRGAAGAFGTPPPGSASGNAMEFHGERACADCDGIEAWLTLQQRGEQRQYQLVEDYRDASRQRRFEDEGEWHSSGDLLRLRSSRGGERVYLVLPDHRLQGVDSRGRALPAAVDDVLVPVAFSSDR